MLTQLLEEYQVLFKIIQALLLGKYFQAQMTLLQCHSSG